MNKVVLIGCGNVGMSYAYALVNQQTSVQELYLIDININKVEGEVMDLNHCLAFAPNKMKIKVGTYEDCKNADIVVIAAGINQLPGESRVDLITKNSIIFKNIIEKVVENNFKGIFLVASNPLDALTYLTYKYSKFPSNKVLGTGTTLDSSRLKYLLGEKLNINPKNIHACVIGEHGDTEFIPWSTATLGLKKMDKMLTNNEKDLFENEVRNSAYEIIKKKGATYYGIGMCMVKITESILSDENNIMTISSYDKKNDVYYSMPTVINRNGVAERLYIELTKQEEKKLQQSIDYIKKSIKEVLNENK